MRKRDQRCQRRQAKLRQLGLPRALSSSFARSARLARRKIYTGVKLRAQS